MSCQTQNERLLAEFKKGQRLTMSQIHRKLHINNPWARISELRKLRHHIEDDTVKTRGGARIKQYWLVQGRKRAA
jgi:hypothetical protein